MIDGFIALQNYAIYEKMDFFIWMKRFNFYKPFSPQLKPKLAYKEFKIICHEKKHFA